jgi:hypothetical protein
LREIKKKKKMSNRINLEQFQRQGAAQNNLLDLLFSDNLRLQPSFRRDEDYEQWRRLREIPISDDEEDDEGYDREEEEKDDRWNFYTMERPVEYEDNDSDSDDDNDDMLDYDLLGCGDWEPEGASGGCSI